MSNSDDQESPNYLENIDGGSVTNSDLGPKAFDTFTIKDKYTGDVGSLVKTIEQSKVLSVNSNKILSEIKAKFETNPDYQDYKCTTDKFEYELAQYNSEDSQQEHPLKFYPYSYLDVLKDENGSSVEYPFEHKPDQVMVMEPIRVLKKNLNLSKVDCFAILAAMKADPSIPEGAEISPLQFTEIVNSLVDIDETIQRISDLCIELFELLDLESKGVLDRTTLGLLLILLSKGNKLDKIMCCFRYLFDSDDDEIYIDGLVTFFSSVLRLKLTKAYTSIPMWRTLKYTVDQTKRSKEMLAQVGKIAGLAATTADDAYDLLEKDTTDPISVEEFILWLEHGNPEIFNGLASL